jgi:predicted ATPase
MSALSEELRLKFNVSMTALGGIFARQVIRLIDNIYSQTMRIYISGERQLTRILTY